MVSDGHDEGGQRQRENIVILVIMLVALIVILLNPPNIDDSIDADIDAGPVGHLVAGR